ncbi:predicted protein [Naegleria gruberi]|uniref:Predicted protein n=1 Tax=Naegleria gruberi TaxID=5762 RepID=D2UZ94_NAEGR|nr:uncharacterized protein NAEGRDRAFT_45423 [Naegleria gruberi]EFC49905.1 predicted protein [Naegleria gruberi]|eukprot:XP_002682649.1 predicted protein [Naegleria gruberi strain NEG-M]
MLARKLFGKCTTNNRHLVLKSSQYATKFYSTSGAEKNLVANIESCIRNINNHYRSKKEKEFNNGLLDLKQFCSQLNDATERKLNEKSWNFLIQQFCRNEAFSDEATFWFRRVMKEKKLATPNSFTLTAILKSFSTIGELDMCEEILQELESQGLCNVFSYIYYTKACLQNGNTEKAFSVIGRMESKQIEPSFGIYIPLLKEATNQNNVEVGLKLYDMIKKSNLASFQLSSCIATFALKVNRPDIAIEEYEKIKQSELMNVITWTCLIQAYIQQNDTEKAIDTLIDMKKHGIYPDSATFTILLSACANSNMYEEGVKIHELAKQTLKDFTIGLSNTIINFYTKCGYSNIAIEECEKLKQNGLMNVVTWTCLIQAYIQQNDIEKAIDMIIDMKKHDSTTFTILLSACANSNMYEEGVKIHELAKQTLKDFTIELSNTIINFYTKCGYSNIAIEEYEKIKQSELMNVITWTCLIQAYIQQNDIEKAIDTLIDMKKHGIYPDSATFTILLSACANSNMYEEGVKIHELAKQTLKDFTIELSNTTINFYTKCGYSNIAIEECEKLKQNGLMNVVTWTCLIQAYIQQNDIEKAIDMIIDMKKHGIYPDSATFTILLSACAKSNMYEEGVKIHELAKQTLKIFSLELSTATINFYTKCGYSNIAIEECEKLKQKGLMNVITWTCLIQAYIQQNDVEKALNTITNMKNSGVVPNSTTFTILLSACANSNMYEEGVKIHELAKQTLKVFTIELSQHNY